MKKKKKKRTAKFSYILGAINAHHRIISLLSILGEYNNILNRNT